MTIARRGRAVLLSMCGLLRPPPELDFGDCRDGGGGCGGIDRWSQCRVPCYQHRSGQLRPRLGDKTLAVGEAKTPKDCMGLSHPSTPPPCHREQTSSLTPTACGGGPNPYTLHYTRGLPRRPPAAPMSWPAVGSAGRDTHPPLLLSTTPAGCF